MLFAQRKRLGLPLTKTHYSIKKPRRNLRFLIFTFLFVAITTRVVGPAIRFFQNIEDILAGDDPYKRASLFAPWKTFTISNPSDTIRTFDLKQNTFVINRLTDKARLASFFKQHPLLSDWITPRVAVEGVNSTLTDQTRFPFVRNSVKEARYGDAGCFLSHIRVLDTITDYAVILEDDSVLQWKLLESTNFTFEAPGDADLLQLFDAAKKRVDVQNHDRTWTRVLGGHGTVGYLITATGAKKLLRCLEKSNLPMDLAFYETPGLRVYLSDPWPLVMHNPHSLSTRRQSNG